MEDYNLKDLYFCGDVHGDYKELVWTIVNKYGLKDSAILVLGDFGVGFDNSMPHLYEWSRNRLEKSNNVIYAIRGNHDDPEYFTDEEKYSYPRLRYLEDHKLYNICGRSIYTIGGAGSTDVSYRLETNQKLASRGKDRRIWWENEYVVQKREDLPNKADIIVSHTAPLSFLPVITKFPETPLWQYEKILEEIIVENFLTMGKETLTQVQETQRVLNRINSRQNTPRHILIKLTKAKSKEQILKAAREKQ